MCMYVCTYVICNVFCTSVSVLQLCVVLCQLMRNTDASLPIRYIRIYMYDFQYRNNI